MKTLALKVLGFFAFALSVFMWGRAESKLKDAQQRVKDAIKTSNEFEEINSFTYVDDPASFLCDEEPEHTTLPKDEKKTCG